MGLMKMLMEVNPSLMSLDMPWAIIKHIREDHIEAFYRTSSSKFIVVIKKLDTKSLTIMK